MGKDTDKKTSDKKASDKKSFDKKASDKKTAGKADRNTISISKPLRTLSHSAAHNAEERENIRMDSLDRELAKQEQANFKANRKAVEDPELGGKTRTQAKVGTILLVLAAATIGSVATVCIMLPNGLTYGGITGIARIIQIYTGLNYSLIYYALSMIIAATVWVTLGIKELRKIILMSLAYPTIMLLLELSGIQYVTDDKLLATVFTGVVMGISGGLTFKAGYSSGGTDSLAKVIKYKKLPHMAINDITFAINSVIVVLSAIVLGLDIALYAIITIYVTTKVGDAVMYGLSTKIVELDIIPSNPDALTQYIMT